MESAILREKQIKGGSRAAKIQLIVAMNPDWADLYDTLV
jgi:putative endonuclease